MKDNIIIIDDSLPIVIDCSKQIKEIKPFNPDYVHIYDPEGDKPLESTKSIFQLLKEESEEKKDLSPERIEYNSQKELLTQIKCLTCHKMNKHPLTPYYNLSTKEQILYKDLVRERFEASQKSIEEKSLVKEDFNKLVVDKILSDEVDISTYPIYN